MNGQGFEMEARETKRIETKHRRIVTPIPVPESFELLKEMQTYEPISNAGQPLIVWDHTEDGYKVFAETLEEDGIVPKFCPNCGKRFGNEDVR